MSLFAAKRSKKSKSDVTDYTVLQEAVARSTVKNAVLGRVVEHVAGRVDGPAEPLYQSTGNPVAPTIPHWKFQSMPGKSIYMQYMESIGVKLPDDTGNGEDLQPVAGAHNYPETDAASSQTTEIGEGVAGDIHKENLAYLAKMTPGELEEQRKQFIDQTDPALVDFLKKYKQKRERNRDIECALTNDHPMGPTLDKKNTSNVNKTVHNPKPMTVNNDSETVEEKVSADIVKDAQSDEPMETDDEPIDESQLPIPPSEAKKWVNMDKVELEKLRWTLPAPVVPPLQHKDGGYVARFSLTGKLMQYDEQGDSVLYHHGDEPGRAGYSLDELLMLARSQMAQQRQLSLTTLAAILHNTHQGYYYAAFQQPLQQTMMDAGLVLLLRFSLDDSNSSVREAGIAALAALLGARHTETAITATQPWAGALRPSLASATHTQVQDDLKEEESELKDVELLQLDVVRCLLRVDLLPRIRYTIEKLSPSPECVLHVLSLLTGAASHSLTAAWKVASCPRLILCLVLRYLPHDVPTLHAALSNDNNLDGIPLTQLLSLIKVLCSWGKNLAGEVMRKCGLMPRILVFASLDPTELALPQAEVLKLCIESYALWAVLLGYGLREPQESLIEFFPVLIKKLRFYIDKVDINENTHSNEFNYNMGAHMINMLSRALSVAATKSMLDIQMKQAKEIRVGVSDRPGDVLQPPVLGWSDMTPVIPLVLTCTHKWLSQGQRADVSHAGYALLGTACRFTENYYLKWKDQRDCHDGEFLSDIEKFYAAHLSPFLNSVSVAHLLEKWSSRSALCSGLESSVGENARNLGSLNTVTMNGSVNPLLQTGSPIAVLAPVMALMDCLHQLHTGLPTAATQVVVDNASIIKYINLLTSKPLSLRSQWFTRIEAEFLAHLVGIASRKGSSNPVLYHHAAVITFSCLQKGQEHLVRNLLTTAICYSNNLCDLSEMNTRLNNVALTDYEPLKSPALFQPTLSPQQLTDKIIDDIDSIGSKLSLILLDDQKTKQSVVWLKDIPFLITSMTVDSSEGLNILDDYWTLLPLKRTLLEKIIKTTMMAKNKDDKEKYEASKKADESDQSKPALISEVVRCLQLTYLCLRYRKKAVLQNSCVTGWIRHISLVFLAANDLFLDHTISSYLQGCLRELFCNGGYNLYDDSLQLQGLGNTFDWYKKLIEQYTAVSYSDSTFALLLLLPAQQKYPIALRSLLWGDLSDCLPLICLKASEVEGFIPVSSFLEPAELDGEMVYKYQIALATGMVSQARTPFLWQVALHHVAAFQQRQR